MGPHYVVQQRIAMRRAKLESFMTTAVRRGRAGIMARRSLFVGVAVAILVVACAVAVRWTAAAALDLFAPASSGKALLLARDGAERFIDIAVKTFAVRPSIAAAAQTQLA